MKLKTTYSLLLPVCLSLSLFSCKTYKAPVATHYGSYEPSLTLTSGQTITGSNVQAKTQGRDKISIDGTAYPAKDVKSYQTTNLRYANVGLLGFAPLAISGPINVYMIKRDYTSTSYSSSGAMRTSSGTSYRYFLQQGDNGPVEPFSLPVVRKYVASDPSSLHLIQKSLAERQKQKIALFGGIGLFGAGLALVGIGMGKSIMSDGRNANLEKSGNTMMLAGAGCMAVSFSATIPLFSIFRYNSRQDAWQAILDFNKNKPGIASH